ncbi:LysE family transporter [Candidatus Thioglobus sp.]|nr:LysE family transporter [Candidatus Thioglobus sp.]
MAIGAQNTFVLKQGIIRRHLLVVALFCSIADALLIVIGVTGISYFFNNFFDEFLDILFGLSSLWLAGYGAIRLKSALISSTSFEIEISNSSGLLQTLSILMVFTFANPHVYLDTMILIGTFSQQYIGQDKIAFTIGASLASFVFFFSLTYGAKLLTPLMKHPYSWRILDGIVSLIMFILAFKMAYAGNWF